MSGVTLGHKAYRRYQGCHEQACVKSMIYYHPSLLVGGSWGLRGKWRGGGCFEGWGKG